MTLSKFTSGTAAVSSEVNANTNAILRQHVRNIIRQMRDRSITLDPQGGEFVEAYTDSNGQGNTVSELTMDFDTNKYKSITSSTEPFVIIVADAVTSMGINNCVAAQIDTNKWILRCNSGTDEVKRAQIYKTLFYGTNGTDPRIVSGVTNLTALKTNVSRDVGKRAHYATATTASPGGTPGNLTGTFANTSTNTDCSSWSYCTSSGAGVTASWEFPNATTLNTANNGTSDETGTDLSADEADNPADCDILLSGTTGNVTVRALVLCVGGLAFVESGNVTSSSSTDFYTDNSVPDFTAVTEDFENVIEHSVTSGTFSSTVSALFCDVLAADWESGATFEFKLTNASEDSDWQPCGEIASFTAFTSEPTSLWIRCNPKSSSPTANYPAIHGVGAIE